MSEVIRFSDAFLDSLEDLVNELGDGRLAVEGGDLRILEFETTEFSPSFNQGIIEINV